MVKLADLIHIANASKTEAQKDAVGKELKKFIHGKKACDPKRYLFSNTGIKIENGTPLRVLGKGVQGAVFYGCLDDACKTKIAVKIMDEVRANTEYYIARKLRGMGVPRMYYFKSCEDHDVLYFEYIDGVSLEKWMKGNRTVNDYRRVISRVINMLKKIHTKYPSFRHHDLHWNNILITRDLTPIIIDFGLSTMNGVRNPNVNNGTYITSGISPKSHPMYDAHYFLNIMHTYSALTRVRKFVTDVLPQEYLGKSTNRVRDSRLRFDRAHDDLPTYDDILKHPFLTGKNRMSGVLKKITSKPKPKPKPKPQPPMKVGTSSAIRRAKAILQKDAEKKTQPVKRAPIRTRDPSVMNQVREIEKRLQPEVVAKPKTPKPKVFINKNGDLKIGTRKCRLYKKDELVKLFKLDPKLTKENMCKLIKNM